MSSTAQDTRALDWEKGDASSNYIVMKSEDIDASEPTLSWQQDWARLNAYLVGAMFKWTYYARGDLRRDMWYEALLRSVQSGVETLETGSSWYGGAGRPSSDEDELLQSDTGRAARRAFLERLIRQLDIDSDVDPGCTHLLDEPTWYAAMAVVGLLREAAQYGLAITHVHVRPIHDVDANQWEELVFDVLVATGREHIDPAWDSMLDQLVALAKEESDPAVRKALDDRIGIHFRQSG